MVSTLRRRRIYLFFKEQKEDLLNLFKYGVLINFNNFIKYKRSIETLIYITGKFLDMYEIYNNLQVNISGEKHLHYLAYKNKKGVIDYISI